MNNRVGTCSLCGGDVVGFRGIWMSVCPPPPDKCTSCGAVAASDVIPMFRPGSVQQFRPIISDNQTSGITPPWAQTWCSGEYRTSTS